MDVTVERALERAITLMYDRLGEPVTIDDMARAAMFSKFHFNRVFQRATGLSPGRFLAALRIERAKQLLVSTSLNVSDIAYLVGYNSMGTFSSRFHRTVGLSPTAYRGSGGLVPWTAGVDAHGGARVGGQGGGQGGAPGSEPGHQGSTLRGAVRHEGGRGGRIHLGLFPGRLPAGVPTHGAVLDRPGGYEFTGVPPGTWYLLAQRAGAGGAAAGAEWGPVPDKTTVVGMAGPIVVGRGAGVKSVDVALRPRRLLDPPVLLGLLGAEPPVPAGTSVTAAAKASVTASAETAAAAPAARPAARTAQAPSDPGLPAARPLVRTPAGVGG